MASSDIHNSFEAYFTDGRITSSRIHTHLTCTFISFAYGTIPNRLSAALKILSEHEVLLKGKYTPVSSDGRIALSGTISRPSNTTRAKIVEGFKGSILKLSLCILLVAMWIEIQ